MLAPTPYFADRGCHVRIYEEARALIAQGCDVRIVTYYIGRDMPGIPVERIPHVPWYRRLTAGPSWQKPLLDILLFFKTLAVARTFKPQILHAHLHEGAFVAMLLKPLLRIPLVMDFQGSLTSECRDHGFFKPGSLLEKCFARIEAVINRSADVIITSSTAGMRSLISEWGVPPEKVTAVIDGVDTHQFCPYPRQQARQRLGISGDAPVVVYLGLLNEYQGIDLLLDAALTLKGQGCNLRLLIMGYPEESYREKALHMGLDDMLTFTGRVDYGEAPLLLSAADLAVSPKLSLSEANGKLFNYMACGLPSVVFDTPVNREILGESGIYAAYGSAASLAACIKEYVSDTERLSGLARAARDRAVRLHAWSERARRIVSIYQSVLKPTPRP
ncbi:MAG TPA: glycosyltransferase family 4 protein [Deltaproteobacteria bacterium]|nr:glycosyltransferase family 4 protein [Deltaproteobacteria bacterium]HQB38051.1 glycosyltransferase family 4 protein [Deltaproteobacteria bacterium]